MTDILGLEAMIFERSGRVDIGTGGGNLALPSVSASIDRFGRADIPGPFSDRGITGGIVVGGNRLA